MKPRVLACVVAYLPDMDRLLALVDRLLPGVTDVLVIDNGQTIDPATAPWAGRAAVQWHLASGNLGVGAALNLARQRVLDGGYDFLLSFDQDSLPPTGYVADLLDVWTRADNAGWAALGPAVRDETTGQPLPVQRVGKDLRLHASRDPWSEEKTVAVDHVITSGCLYSAQALSQVGPFRADWFVDMIDIEWCWRARCLGLGVMQTGSVVLLHTIGKAGVKVLGRQVLAHPPARIYFQIRNTLWLLRSSLVPRGWRQQLLAPMARKILLQLLLPDQRWARMRAVVRGGAHGLLKRSSGPGS